MTARHLPPPVPVTTLRVYEPLEAFAAGARSALTELTELAELTELTERVERVERVAGPDACRDAARDATREAEEAERLASWRGVLGRRPGRGPVRARVLRVAGAALVAPVGVGDPDRRHAMVRAWALPVAWLAVVRAEDLTHGGGPGRYVLPMSSARSRSARVLRSLRSGLGEGGLTGEVEELARWLEQFHPRSWVELDTRPVAALVGGEDGADDVRLGLECLAAGEVSGLAAAYRRVSTRSHRLESLSVSS